MQSAVVMQSTAMVQSTPPLDLRLVGGSLTLQLVVIVIVTVTGRVLVGLLMSHND